MNIEKTLSKLNEFLKQNDLTIISELKKELEEDLRQKISKNKNGVKRDSLIKKIMQSAKKNNYALYGYIPCGSLFGFCDGYRVYMLKDNYGYNQAETVFELEKLKPNDNKIEIKIDIADLKFFLSSLKIAKKSLNLNPYILQKDDFKIAFNAKYLLEFTQMLNTDTILCGKTSIRPAFYESNDGEWGILLPCKLKKTK